MFLLIGNMLQPFGEFPAKIVFFLVLKVAKKSDLSDFYFNIGKNVALGAKDIASGQEAREAS